MIDIAVPIKSWRFVAVHEKRKEGTYPSISCSKVQNAVGMSNDSHDRSVTVICHVTFVKAWLSYDKCC
jgi:hypothetical protein